MNAWWKIIQSAFIRYRHLLWLILITLSLAGFLYLLPAGLRADLLQSILTQRRLTVMLLAFGLLALSLLWSLGQRIDVWTFLYFNIHGNRPKWLDGIMLLLTQGGNGITAFFTAGFYYLRDLRILATMIVFGTLTLWLVVEFVKAIIQRARPFEKLLEVRVVGGRAIGRSFPSGHTSQAFFLVTLLAQFYQLGIGVALLLYGLAALIGITRMYVGAHYPRDVLAGAILGSVWGVLGEMLHTQLMG